MRRGWLAWTLAVLLALIAVNAVVAGILFVLKPDGSAIGIPQDWLDGTPFPDYTIPGILLTGLGILHGVAAWAELAGWPLAWTWAGASAVGLGIWIVVQALLMGSPRHPIQTTLQASCLTIAAATGVLALVQRKRGTP